MAGKDNCVTRLAPCKWPEVGPYVFPYVSQSFVGVRIHVDSSGSSRFVFLRSPYILWMCSRKLRVPPCKNRCTFGC